MTENQYKENRNRLRNMRIQNARTLGEQYPEVERVEITACVAFDSDIDGMDEKHYGVVITPSDYLYVYFPCLNRTCTGYGFDLTDTIREAIKNKKDIEIDRISCDGKVDWKYLDHSGYSCESEISFSVHLQFSSDNEND